MDTVWREGVRRGKRVAKQAAERKGEREREREVGSEAARLCSCCLAPLLIKFTNAMSAELCAL